LGLGGRTLTNQQWTEETGLDPDRTCGRKIVRQPSSLRLREPEMIDWTGFEPPAPRAPSPRCPSPPRCPEDEERRRQEEFRRNLECEFDPCKRRESPRQPGQSY
ncbi:hypothetical protein J6590_103644, partial [Homalodisca vitripennis]